MNVWIAKRENTASRWSNFEFMADGYFGDSFSHFVAYRTRKEAKAFCDDMLERHGTKWIVVKFTEAK